MTHTVYHTITDEDRLDLLRWLSSKGFDGKPGPAYWLRSMIFDWAQANRVPYANEEGIPYEYNELERMAYDSMVSQGNWWSS